MAGPRSKEVAIAKATSAVPEGYYTVAPQLALYNAAQAIDWSEQALGADEVSRMVGPDRPIVQARCASAIPA